MRLSLKGCAHVLLYWLALSLMLGWSAHSLAQTTELACAAIQDDTLRLRCYDQRFRPAAGPAAETAPPAPLLQPAEVRDSPPSSMARRLTYLERQWQLGEAASEQVLRVLPYRPLYLFPVSVTDETNPLPSSPAAGRSVTGTGLNLQPAEAVFQISFKTKLWHRVLNTPLHLWAGYTQKSYWQIFNSDTSRPFRETVYEPEMMLTLPTGMQWGGLQIRMLGLAINHQSNGRPLPQSRSWNRVMGLAGLQYGQWSVMARPWWRLPEDGGGDNPDIANFAGRMDVSLLRDLGQRQTLGLTFQHSLRSGTQSHGSGQVEYSWPLYGDLRGRVHLFSGYGENLIDYNLRQTRLGFGVSLGQ
jgi:phospholipase A1/A2